MGEEKFHVALVGGGLCSLGLAIALSRRGISYTLYEARGSLSEIGAGINLGPNALQAFGIIDPSLRDSIFALATRNPPGKEDVWMTVRLAAPTAEFDDAASLLELLAPPTGSMTLARTEFLQLLADRTRFENLRFKKKLVGLRQSPTGVSLTFGDGTIETASVVIGCDGAHSAVRRLMLPPDHPAAVAQYSGLGLYRAVLPMEVNERCIGVEKAHRSHIWAGPQGHVIMYPIEGGKKVNLGFWPGEKEWKGHGDDSWTIPNQRAQMMEDFKEYGETIHRVLDAVDDDVQFWATHHHSVQPASHFDGRIAIIGDASHAMGPHQGQGAAQAMEDACVMAEVLKQIDSRDSSHSLGNQIAAAFTGYEAVRKPHFDHVLATSHEGFSLWSYLWSPDLSLKDIERFKDTAYARFRPLWEADIAAQGEEAKATMYKFLSGSLT